MKKRNISDVKLDREEQDLLESVERGEWKTTENAKEELSFAGCVSRFNDSNGDKDFNDDIGHKSPSFHLVYHDISERKLVLSFFRPSAYRRIEGQWSKEKTLPEFTQSISRYRIFL